MELTGKQRLKAYAMGALGGGVLMGLLLWHHGLPKPVVLPEPGVERRQVPGILAQWMATGQPVEGSFVVSQMMEPRAANGTRVCAVVVPGLDDGSFVRVEEQWGPETPPMVQGWKFMYADRVKVKLRDGADTAAFAARLQKSGWHFLKRDPASGWVTIGLDSHAAKTVPEALAQLRTWSPWVEAAEVDELPAPGSSGQ
jgi:hypothetical protein